MATSPSTARAAATNPMLSVLKDTMVASVRSDKVDLTARQLAVFLSVYLEQGTEHTVRGLASKLNVAKPAITRALDKLGALDLTKREQNKADRRSIFVRRTPAGTAYLRTLGGYMADASKQAQR
jgi:DNA-binding MarR family transcriptional regulator